MVSAINYCEVDVSMKISITVKNTLQFADNWIFWFLPIIVNLGQTR